MCAFSHSKTASLARANKLHVHESYFCRYTFGGGGFAPPPPPNTKKLATLLLYSCKMLSSISHQMVGMESVINVFSISITVYT